MLHFQVDPDDLKHLAAISSHMSNSFGVTSHPTPCSPPSPPVNAIPQIYILKINRSPAVQPGWPHTHTHPPPKQGRRPEVSTWARSSLQVPPSFHLLPLAHPRSPPCPPLSTPMSGLYPLSHHYIGNSFPSSSLMLLCSRMRLALRLTPHGLHSEGKGKWRVPPSPTPHSSPSRAPESKSLFASSTNGDSSA